MKRLVLILIVSFSVLPAAHAVNYPCSGRKGGISHCQGEKFVCRNGTVSRSKKRCFMGYAAGDRQKYMPPFMKNGNKGQKYIKQYGSRMLSGEPQGF